MPLGAGGMGEVSKARDTWLERWVTVKVLPRQLADSPDGHSHAYNASRKLSRLYLVDGLR